MNTDFSVHTLEKSEVLKRLNANKTDLFKKYPLTTLALFGSTARGDNSPESDIDIMVEFKEPVGIEFIDLLIDLENIFGGIKVGLTTKRSIKPHYWAYIEKDLIYV